MSATVLAMHYVCTLEQARDLVDRHNRYWVCTCGCREGRGHCDQSRADVCLQFAGGPSSGPGVRECSRSEVEEILTEAEEKWLVARPFRTADRTETEGICFCCKDCCGYFLDPQERCDKGSLLEQTDMEGCTSCAVCVDICYFDARFMVEDRLEVDRAACYGCGLCARSCPILGIEMVAR